LPRLRQGHQAIRCYSSVRRRLRQPPPLRGIRYYLYRSKATPKPQQTKTSRQAQAPKTQTHKKPAKPKPKLTIFVLIFSPFTHNIVLSKQPNQTPLARQYAAIKAKYPGALLLFRVGDFYETFGPDAIRASKILGIVLTKRGNGSESDTALAGFPHHSLDAYLPKLVRAGERVAICDQLEDPKQAQGIVKRGVTELVTPGVSYNDNVLEARQNNYLAALHFAGEHIGLALLDISTGEFTCTQGSKAYILKLIQSFNPAEIIYCKTAKTTYHTLFAERYNTYQLPDWVFDLTNCHSKLTQHFKTTSLKGFGIDNLDHAIIAAGTILHYLAETEHHQLGHISKITRIEADQYVWLDRFTIRNLELVYAQQDGGVPLINVLDHTLTPMGARLMRKWVVLPLKVKSQIDDRLSTVEMFVNRPILHDNLSHHLRPIGDLERLISKVAVGRINPREMVSLMRALQKIEPIKQLLLNSKLEAIDLEPITETTPPPPDLFTPPPTAAPAKVLATDQLSKAEANILHKYADQLNPCAYLLQKIESTLRDDAPMHSNQGGMVKTGVDTQLDYLHQLAYTGKDYLAKLQVQESARSGIGSLKIAYNKVFGYYLEVSNTHKDKVPADWIRKQTLVNAERYITPELKEYEDKILSAEDKIFTLEQKIFQDLVAAATEYVQHIQQNAAVLAQLDALLSFAKVSLKNNYTKPTVTDHNELHITAGRHPVIELSLPLGESYVPNDIQLNQTDQQIIIITGPNMAGKSALLRQTALIVLMAQIGCYVPASEALIGIVDKIFTRVGASDNLSRGESTFMVEMTETASILNNLSDKSLLLMDEIGRGTSTYDGVSIAWSIAEYLHNHPSFKPKTLFATHYHELNELAKDLPRVKNFNVAVKEIGNNVVFLRKLQAGGSEHSFGIHVAAMAGMPQQIVTRAGHIMSSLEADPLKNKNNDKIPKNTKTNSVISVNPVFENLKFQLSNVDINSMSPVEALLKLNELTQLLKNEKN
jgi:DNA mismatch repair protein MutS